MDIEELPEDVRTGSGIVDSLLPEYEKAVQELQAKAIHGLMMAQSEFISRLVRIEYVDHLPGESLPSEAGGRGIIMNPTPTRYEFIISKDAIINLDIEQWIDMIQGAVESGIASMHHMLIKLMDSACKASGNVFESRGGFNNDSFLDMLERVPLEPDEDGRFDLSHLVIVGSEEIERQAKNLPPRTPEQEERLNNILQKKKEEYDARRRVHKLG